MWKLQQERTGGIHIAETTSREIRWKQHYGHHFQRELKLAQAIVIMSFKKKKKMEVLVVEIILL